MAVFLLLLPKKISRETVIAIIVLRLYPYRKKIQTYMHTEHWILKHQLTDIKAVNQQPNISKQTGRKHTCELCDFQHMFPLNSQNNDKKKLQKSPLPPVYKTPQSKVTWSDVSWKAAGSPSQGQSALEGEEGQRRERTDWKKQVKEPAQAMQPCYITSRWRLPMPVGTQSQRRWKTDHIMVVLPQLVDLCRTTGAVAAVCKQSVHQKKTATEAFHTHTHTHTLTV